MEKGVCVVELKSAGKLAPFALTRPVFVCIDHKDNVFVIVLHSGDDGTEVLKDFVSWIGVVVSLLQESLLL